jgi:hypothetical protein
MVLLALRYVLRAHLLTHPLYYAEVVFTLAKIAPPKKNVSLVQPDISMLPAEPARSVQIRCSQTIRRGNAKNARNLSAIA